MLLQIPRTALGRALTAVPKVIFSSLDLSENVVVPRQGLPVGAEELYEFWSFSRDARQDEGLLVPDRSDAATPLARLAHPPSASCLLVAGSEAGLVELSCYQSWARVQGRDISVISVPGPVLGPAARSIWLEALLDMLRNEAQAAKDHSLSLLGQLAEIRGELDKTRTAAQVMQNRLFQFGERPHLLFQCASSKRAYAPHDGNGTIAQELTVHADGFCGIDLHFQSQPQPDEDGHLHVMCHVKDSVQVLGEWHFSAHDLADGVIRCWLPAAAMVFTCHLEVVVAWAGKWRRPPAILLSNFGDFPEYAARGPEGPLPGTLAMDVWVATPGMKLLPRQNHLAHAPDGSFEYLLSARDFKQLKSVTPANKDEKLDHLHSRPDGFYLFPLLNQVAVSAAVLRGACPAGLLQVAATVRVDHPEARSPVQYGILVGEAEDLYRAICQANNRPESVEGFSGWRSVLPDRQPHAVVLSLTKPLRRRAHLLFATRVGPGETNHFAAARWDEVRLTVAPRRRLFGALAFRSSGEVIEKPGSAGESAIREAA